MSTKENAMIELDEDFATYENALKVADKREQQGLRTQVLEFLRIAIKLYLKDHKEDKIVANLYERVGKNYKDLKCYYMAYGYLMKAHNLYKELCGEDSEEVAMSYFNLGEFFLSKADYYNAVSYYDVAVKKLKKIYGEDSKEIAPYLVILARSYDLASHVESAFIKKSDYLEKVIRCYEKALALYRKFYDANDLVIATILIEIGDVYKNIERQDGDNEWEKAILYWNEAIGIYIANYKEESKEVANLFYIIGCAIRNFKLKNKRAIGRYEKVSISYLEKALEILAKLDMSQSEMAGKINYKLGRNYLRLDSEKAIKCFKDRIEIYTKVFGEDNEHLEACYLDLVNAYETLGKDKEAQEVEREYDEMYKRQHPFTILEGEISPEECLRRAKVCENNNLLDFANDYYKKAANLYFKDNKIEKQAEVFLKIATNHIVHNYHLQNAIEYLRKAVDIYEEIGGIEENKLASMYLELAIEYNKIAQFTSAINFTKKAQEIYIKDSTNYYGELANCYYQKGLAYANLEKCEFAIKLYKEAINIAQKLNTFSEIIPQSNLAIASCCTKAGQLKDAIHYCGLAKDFYEPEKDKYEDEYVKCYLTLGKLCQELKLYDRAIETLFEGAFVIGENNYYKDLTKEVCSALADNYMFKNDLVNTAKWREKALLVQKYKYPSQFVGLASLLEDIGEFEKAAFYYELAVSRAAQFGEEDGVRDNCYRKMFDLYKKIDLEYAADWIRKEFI